MSVAQYRNRTVDVMAFQGVRERGSVQLIQALATADSPGALCTGIQKLAQRFLLEFLTERGSMRYLPTRGTDFMTSLRQGYFHSEPDVFAAFSIAVGQIETNLRNDRLAADPLDEQFASAELAQVVLIGTDIELHINLQSRAGTSREVILPLSTVVT